MTYTHEPRGLQLINNLNMATLGSLVTNLLWMVGSLKFTWVVCDMLQRKDPVGITAMGLMLGAWGYKTTAGVFDANNKRKAHPNYAPVLEAEARGKVTGAAAAAVIAEKAADARAARITSEHVAQAPVNITAKDQSIVEVAAPVNGQPAKPGRSDAEPDALTDDERGS